MNANGHESPKWVKSKGAERSVIFADSNASPESVCAHFSSVRKLESDGQSGVIVCPSARAKAYPSPVEPV